MHKLHLILLFLFSPLAAMLNPAIPSSDGICHLARLPREIRDRIARFVLYETDDEFTTRAAGNYKAKKNKPKTEMPKIPGSFLSPLLLKFSPNKTYLAEFKFRLLPTLPGCYDLMPSLNITGPRFGEVSMQFSSHLHDHKYEHEIGPLSDDTCHIAFNKQRTKILTLRDGKVAWAMAIFSLPDFFLEEKYTGSCEENSLREFFLRKLVCKRLENSLAKKENAYA